MIWAEFISRGLIYQYLTVPLLLSDIKAEVALRIIPVISNIAVIPVLFKLSKKISSNVLISSVVIILFSFSVWETEIARLARFYAPFQLVFILYLYFLYQIVIENKDKSYKWLFVLSFLSIFLYEGSIFLVVLNLFPLLFSGLTRNKIKFVISLILLFFAVIYFKEDLRNFGVTDFLPDAFLIKNSSELSLPIFIPPLLIMTLSSESYLILLFGIVLLGSGYTLYVIVKSSQLDLKLKISLSIIISLLFFNLFSFSVIIFLILFLLHWIKPEDLRTKQFRLVAYLFVLNLVMWGIYSVLNHNMGQFFS